MNKKILAIPIIAIIASLVFVIYFTGPIDIWDKYNPGIGNWTDSEINSIMSMPCDEFLTTVTIDINDPEQSELIEQKLIECGETKINPKHENCRPLIQNGNEFLICDD